MIQNLTHYARQDDSIPNRQPVITVGAPPVSTEQSAFTKQEGGSHYTDCKIQPFEYSMANKLDPMQHTIIKYVTRFRNKNGMQDLLKAKHTLELLIEWETKNATPAK